MRGDRRQLFTASLIRISCFQFHKGYIKLLQINFIKLIQMSYSPLLFKIIECLVDDLQWGTEKDVRIVKVGWHIPRYILWSIFYSQSPFGYKHFFCKSLHVNIGLLSNHIVFVNICQNFLTSVVKYVKRSWFAGYMYMTFTGMIVYDSVLVFLLLQILKICSIVYVYICFQRN